MKRLRCFILPSTKQPKPELQKQVTSQMPEFAEATEIIFPGHDSWSIAAAFAKFAPFQSRVKLAAQPLLSRMITKLPSWFPSLIAAFATGMAGWWFGLALRWRGFHSS